MQAQEKNKEVLGHMLLKVPTIAQKLNLTNGYRLVINEGKEGCQQVMHLHIHLLGGRQMHWPPG
jgi:histidine triad (HIT) family protein